MLSLAALLLAGLGLAGRPAASTCVTDSSGPRNRSCVLHGFLQDSSGAAAPAPNRSYAAAAAAGADRGAAGRGAAEAPPPARSLYAKTMPAAIRAILLGRELAAFDPLRSGAMLGMLKEGLPFQYFSHARDTFVHHLRGTWGILNAWGQGEEICRAGLFHTAYGADLFVFSTLDPHAEGSRRQLRAVLGEAAEALTWDFGTLSHSALNASLFPAGAEGPNGGPASAAAAGDPSIPAQGMLLDSYLEGGKRVVSARQLAKMSMVRIADNLDQMVEVNLWRDVHSFEVPSVLYPGAMRPAMGLHWLSRLCKGIRGFLDVVPPIFDHCTAEISYEAEAAALELYWAATASTDAAGAGAGVAGAGPGAGVEGVADSAAAWSKVEMLRNATSLNPFIAEPHVYLAELHFQAGRYADCAREAARALEIFYQMSTQWDKRLPLRQWVNTARMFLVRCVRKEEGLSSFPISPHGVVSTQELVREMDRVSPVAGASPGEGPGVL